MSGPGIRCASLGARSRDHLSQPWDGGRRFTPLRVLAVQRGIQDEIERQPSKFLLRELCHHGVGLERPERPRMRQAAEGVARHVGARADDLVRRQRDDRRERRARLAAARSRRRGRRSRHGPWATAA
ncbi:MAG: hypothetical protein R2862_02245 [Thermoanaerobaculia bacterium]